jgi:hypothetical protein
MRVKHVPLPNFDVGGCWLFLEFGQDRSAKPYQRATAPSSKDVENSM